jgi:hypothetical protein
MAKLETEREALQHDAGQVLGCLDALIQTARRTGPAAADECSAHVQLAIEKIAGPLLYGWNHSGWDSFEGPPPELVLTRTRIGRLRDPDPLPGERAAPDVPSLISLLEAPRPILIVCTEATKEVARTVFQSLLLRIAVSMPSQVRFTLLDPIGLGAAFPFRGFINRVRPTGRTAADELAEVLDDIRRINERVIGQADRFIELTSDQRAGEAFEIVAGADFPKAYAKDPRAVEHLVRIGTSGARAGRHLILEWHLDAPLPHDFSADQFQNAIIVDSSKLDFAIDSLPNAARQKQLIDIASRSGLQHKSGDWESVVRPTQFFSQSSKRRVETPIGERLRIWLGDDDEGKPSAHAMIGGQIGSGKSYLLHVLITGLASRYSPEELQFVLIDGKQGVEFEVYRELPHADIVCLHTSPAMARSALADFVAEMEHRYELFQATGTVKLEEYRQKTGQRMPRKILIVDEYQQLLEGDPERGSQLLTRILEKGRAAGTHVVLGSQTFQPQGLPPSALTHVHTRASLSLAQDYIQTIQVFGGEGKRLIRELAPSGQVVLNDESGRDGANSRGAVARFRRTSDSNTLSDAIADIIAAAGAPGQAVVLSGRDAAVVSENPFAMAWRQGPPDPPQLQEIARRPTRDGGFGLTGWTAVDKPIGLWLGRRFDVHGHALCVLRRAPTQNMLVLGAQVEVRNRMLASALAALPTMVAATELNIALIDGVRAEMPGAGMLRLACAQLGAAGARVSIAEDAEAEPLLASIEKEIQSSSYGSRHTILIIAEPEYLYSTHISGDRFAPPTSGAPALLRTILSRGPQIGVYTILTASGLPALATVLSPSREIRFFNHRVVQQMNDDETMSLFASLAAARINEQTDHPFACLLVDQIQGIRASVLFHAYAAQAGINSDQGLTALQSTFARVSAR